jgi:DNA-directed RNA polymerase subunit RPC12/RpoP
MSNKVFSLVTASGLGLLGGLLLGSANKNLAQTIGFGTGGALFCGGIVAFIYDTKLNTIKNKLEASITKLTIENTKLKTLLETANQLKFDIQNARDTALTTVTGLKTELTLIKSQLQQESNKSLELSQENNRLLIWINELEGEARELTQICENKEAELREFSDSFNQRLDSELTQEFTAKKEQIIQQEVGKEFELTQEAFFVIEQMQSLVKEVYERHQGQRHLLLNTHSQYLDHHNTAIAKHQEAYDTLVEVKDGLELRVRMLEQQLAGELLEPQYGDFGFDINGKIANEIARTLFSDLRLALSVKGFQVKPDGVVDIGYGYSQSVNPRAIVEAISKHSEVLVKKLGLFKITSVRKLEVTDCIVVSYRVEPAIKADEIKLMLGTADEFINYVVSHPIRYRLIADPGMGKTPTSAVMISEILKAGCTRGNTGKGERVPHTLVNVSYPGAVGSLKDSSYPLEPFLKYGDTTAAIKSFEDCLDDGRFRIQNTQYAANYFQIWVWEELDNTLNSSSEPYQTGENFKKILKQFGHNNIGWIVSGQSVMTKQIPGFTNDDRSLFTEIIIGIPKIRHYLNTYGKGKNSESNLGKLTRNLDAIEEYIDHKNELVTDDARLLRVALVVDSRSPKLYFLPNLDRVSFNYQEIEEVKRLARLAKSPDTTGNGLVSKSPKLYTASAGTMASLPPISTIGGSHQSGTIPHCPHCGSANLKLQNDNRYRCLNCKKRTVSNKIVWK